MNRRSSLLFFCAGYGLSVVEATSATGSPLPTRLKSSLKRYRSCSDPLAFGLPFLPTQLISADIDQTFLLTRVLALTASSVITYLALAAGFDRPQGELSAPPNALVAQPSQVEGAGLGLYTNESMAEGTILGTYPGVVRTASSYLGKYGRYPHAGSYAWRFTDSKYYIDPTDSQGNIAEICYGGSAIVPGSIFVHEQMLAGLSAVPTLLARINEPPVGGPGCNIFARENIDQRTVTFMTSRDVVEGEELFMDYGTTYDRGSYAPPS